MNEYDKAIENSKKWRKDWADKWNKREKQIIIMKYWLLALTVGLFISFLI